VQTKQLIGYGKTYHLFSKQLSFLSKEVLADKIDRKVKSRRIPLQHSIPYNHVTPPKPPTHTHQRNSRLNFLRLEVLVFEINDFSKKTDRLQNRSLFFSYDFSGFLDDAIMQYFWFINDTNYGPTENSSFYYRFAKPTTDSQNQVCFFKEPQMGSISLKKTQLFDILFKFLKCHKFN